MRTLARKVARADGARTDAGDPFVDLTNAFDDLLRSSGLGDSLAGVVGKVDTAAASYTQRVMKLPPGFVVTQQVQEEFRARNVALIKGLGADHAREVGDILRVATATGQRHEELIPLIEDRLKVGKNRARLIAVDQTNKLNADLQQAHAEAAGVTEYDWSTSKHENVRPDHKRLEGKRFRYDSPPITNTKTGARNNPGKDINCKCTAIPVVPLFDAAGPLIGPKGALNKTPAPATARSRIPQEALQGFGQVAAPWEPQRAAEVARAYAGLSRAEVREVALGRRPTANTAGRLGREQALPPVKVHVELNPDGTVASRTIVDGNHRIAGARAAGATQVNAVVTVEQRTASGKVRKVGTHKGPISI